jgi:nitric oxide reductase subunit C
MEVPMLSKSQAKWFFLIFTAGFSGVFLWLTVDTLMQVPERSHAEKIDEHVIRGKEIWEENNCMGCHTLLGEGAYYAPELTKVVERRGAVWIRAFIKDPEAMYPGQRKMVKYDFTEDQITDVIAFLSWVGNIDTNGFPAKPDLAPASLVDVPGGTAKLAAAPAIYGQLCQACHAIGGQGGVVGPALDTVGARFDEAWFAKWLTDPNAIRPGSKMPKMPLSDADKQALAKWLSTLK